MDLGFFQFNQVVTLVSDDTFRGYFQAKVVSPDPGTPVMVLISISEPGQTGLRGYRSFPLEELRPVKGVAK